VENAGPENGGTISFLDLNWNKTQKRDVHHCINYCYLIRSSFFHGCSYSSIQL